jgi:3'(2'), 5'-bisphosphate nucleotidase/myo-inositol-1(or 4)-monophosphatase
MIEQLAEMVTAVGRDILSWRGSAAAQGTWQGSQLKTEADLRAHAALTARLNKAFPGVPVVSEEDESSQSPLRPPRYWLIDPIDGTASFSEGYAGYVTQIAFIQEGQPQLGAIYAPALDLLYLAERGGGATLNGREMKLTPDVSRCVLVDNYPEPRGAAKFVFDRLRCTDYVESGSLALKICRVADGTADLFVKDIPVRDWDIAPASLILEEAGGALTEYSGGSWQYSGSYQKNGVIAGNSPAMIGRVLVIAAVK